MAEPPRNYARPSRLLAILGAAIGAIIVLGLVVIKLLPPPPPSPPPLPSPEVSATTSNRLPAPPAGARLIDTDNLSVTAPAGWQVKEKPPEGVILQNEHGQLMLAAKGMSQSDTPVDLLRFDLANAINRHPDAHVCYGPQPWSMPNGPADGQVAIFCYQSSPDQSQQSYQVAELWIEAVDSSATVEFFVSLWVLNAPNADAVNAFTQEAEPVITTVVWHPTALPSDAPYHPPPHQVFCLPTLYGRPMPCVP